MTPDVNVLGSLPGTERSVTTCPKLYQNHKEKCPNYCSIPIHNSVQTVKATGHSALPRMHQAWSISNKYVILEKYLRFIHLIECLRNVKKYRWAHFSLFQGFFYFRFLKPNWCDGSNCFLAMIDFNHWRINFSKSLEICGSMTFFYLCTRRP